MVQNLRVSRTRKRKPTSSQYLETIEDDRSECYGQESVDECQKPIANQRTGGQTLTNQSGAGECQVSTLLTLPRPDEPWQGWDHRPGPVSVSSTSCVSDPWYTMPGLVTTIYFLTFMWLWKPRTGDRSWFTASFSSNHWRRHCPFSDPLIHFLGLDMPDIYISTTKAWLVIRSPLQFIGGAWWHHPTHTLCVWPVNTKYRAH